MYNVEVRQGGGERIARKIFRSRPEGVRVYVERRNDKTKRDKREKTFGFDLDTLKFDKKQSRGTDNQRLYFFLFGVMPKRSSLFYIVALLCGIIVTSIIRRTTYEKIFKRKANVEI